MSPSAPRCVGVEDLTAPAALLAVAADPVRLAILHQLADGPSCVCQLQPRLRIADNLLSYHLKVLRDARLVGATRRGRWIDYVLANDALERLHAALPGRSVTR